MGSQPTTPSLLQHYRRILTSRSGTAAAEAAGAQDRVDFSDPWIAEHVGAARRELRRIVREHLGNQQTLLDLTDRIAIHGDLALHKLRDDDPALARDAESLDALEAIVRTDGSRPSFMIRNGVVDRSTSPIGDWGPILDTSAEPLRDAVRCVGRIDSPNSEQGFEGTGFLVQERMVLTNRHVLQAVASPTESGEWQFNEGATIDFGREFRAVDSDSPRPLKTVLFAGSQSIPSSGSVDHSKLDLALIELDSAATPPRCALAVDVASDWAQPPQTIFACGFPANPGILYTPTLLELLFQSTFGCKRLAPGVIMKSSANVAQWTLAHDATTIGGNSGSVVLVAGRERVAAGLHYGGRRGEPRENWGHVIGRVLDEKDHRSGATLRQLFIEYGVRLVDRN